MNARPTLEHLLSLHNLVRHSAGRNNDASRAERGRRLAEAAAGFLRGNPARSDLLSALGLLYQAGGYEEIYELFPDLCAETGDDLPARLAVSAAFALGRPDRALRAAKAVHDPEARRLRQKTAELWEDLHAPLEREPRVHLLVLTHNRKQHAEHALRRLAGTAYGNYAVYIADNGSEDGTWETVRRACRIFPASVPVLPVRFPTNIGRPAGHNWLLTAHDHSAADYIAIGDDDLIRVPPDWLSRMVLTARLFPDCACVGGKGLTPGWPARVHAGIRNFTNFGNGSVDLTNSDEQDDLGQFDYLDMVDHVIGCLHIFDRRHLEETGLFDIRFSPCQCVDIEHHLRMRLAGKTIVFNGLIAFEHLRGMGRALTRDAALMGNSIGNVVKLLYKYQPETVARELTARRRERNAWLGFSK
jgi:GT2 family glycosyltransferase